MNLETTQQAADEIEILRMIIQDEQNSPVSYDEALEVGESLISYFKTLASEEMDKTEEDEWNDSGQ